MWWIGLEGPEGFSEELILTEVRCGSGRVRQISSNANVPSQLCRDLPMSWGAPQQAGCSRASFPSFNFSDACGVVSLPLKLSTPRSLSTYRGQLRGRSLITAVLKTEERKRSKPAIPGRYFSPGREAGRVGGAFLSVRLRLWFTACLATASPSAEGPPSWVLFHRWWQCSAHPS